ncbi:MAG: 3-phosphoshikimate 1-carboxyvinyltransferase [Ruminococcus sp.]|nr:3-phosphoshikimate 1-carboxyvinyltransferase [Ruminococcus sp.]
MDMLIKPSVLKGDINIPASKSCAHRAIICAALADGVSRLSGVTMSKDIEATLNAMSALGAEFDIDGENITVSGIKNIPENAVADCAESGSTLRFVIPVAAALGVGTEFLGRGRLPQRPIDIYVRELGKNGINFDYNNTMPFGISGKLRSGRYEIEGNVSSQFITGLLFALPLLDGNSEIILTSHLESRPYVDITIDILKRYGIDISETENGFYIKGKQKYKPRDEKIEGDYSQAAFFFTANTINSQVNINNLNPDSVQGDRKILDIISDTCRNGKINSFDADCSDIPDLVPILTVLAAYGNAPSRIYNAERLKIKESNRLESAAAMINSLGGNAEVTDDGIIITPTGGLKGGTVDGFGDHRIVMSAAVAALGCEGDVIIRGAQAAEKSYPEFFGDYIKAGGNADVISME